MHFLLSETVADDTPSEYFGPGGKGFLTPIIWSIGTIDQRIRSRGRAAGGSNGISGTQDFRHPGFQTPIMWSIGTIDQRIRSRGRKAAGNNVGEEKGT
jgi:hypothetical protein